MGELQLIVDIRNQMQHFITNLQYYVMFEVLEASWRQLETDMAAAAHLDALLDAHAKYVQTIVDRSMLSETASLLHHQVLVHTPDISTHKPAVPSHICAGVGPHLRRNRPTSAPGPRAHLFQVNRIFNVIIRFCQTQDVLAEWYAYSEY
jgi:hypothetical protein